MATTNNTTPAETQETVLLDVQDVAFSFRTYAGEVQAVRGVSFTLARGKCLGIVGESGCGKSVMAKSIIRLNPSSPKGIYKRGQILFEGRDLLSLSKRAMESVRASEIRMIFQDPMSSLNPTMTIGKQIVEGILKSGVKNKAEAKQIAIRTLSLAGIPSPDTRYKQYPHEFSGGMRQRAMIALAMAVNPKLLIADEPTTALDVTIQAQILDLIKDIQKQYNTALIMITHDLGVVSNIADCIAVMYAGKVMEYGKADDIFEHPAHPYTWGVLQSIPPEDTSSRKPLHPILGSPPAGCPFTARCPYAMKVCAQAYPAATPQTGEGHWASCWLYHQKAPVTVNPITEQEVVRNG